MKLKFFKPVGFYPPLIWHDEEENRVKPSIKRCLILANLLVRFLFYPFNFTASVLITAGSILVATFFNIGWLFGGFLNKSWRKRTKKLNQIAITRSQWVIFDGLGFLWNQAKLLISLIRPAFGISTIKRLKNTSKRLTKKSLFHFDWQKPHHIRIKSLMHFLIKKNLFGLGIFINTLSAETMEAISFGIQFPRGLFKNSHAHGLNPETLTAEQAKQTPLLLIHGNYHNQSAWFGLTKYLHKHHYSNPIFTVNLPSGKITVEDKKIIEDKIQKIKALYAQHHIDEDHFKINLMGHSRGAYLAYMTGFSNWNPVFSTHTTEKRKIVSKTILLGFDFDNADQIVASRKDNSIIFINGRNDSLLFFKKKPNTSEDHCLVNAGHLSVLSHSKTFKKAINALK